MNIDLQGKRALVCGASRGIGRACAIALAQHGAEIVAAARDTDRLEKLTRELPAGEDRQHTSISVDFSDRQALNDALRDATARGSIEIIVNNSGGPAAGSAIDADPPAFEDAFRQHLIADQIILQKLLPGMKAAAYGRVINIISTSVKEPIPGLGVSNVIR
ncbi:MAG: SDR family NAD(P)-dependent oxidoreductase, partial [Gammaproteobacteria bacterium]